MDKVKYIGATDGQVQWGSNDDPRGLLTEGEWYEVEDREVHSWHTQITLVGVKGRFNSVCFEDEPEDQS